MDNTHRQQLTEALIQAALIESKEISVHLAEVIAYLQRHEHQAALGTLQIIEEPLRFVSSMLIAAVRLTQ